jgi:hypothetical protein
LFGCYLPDDFDLDELTPTESPNARRKPTLDETQAANLALVRHQEAVKQEIVIHPLAVLKLDDVPCKYKHERTELELTQLRLRVGQLEAALVELKRIKE